MASKHPSSENEYSLFTSRVLEIICLVPYGSVASYGQIALFVGAPRAARQVGWILNQSADKEQNKEIPWWRIVNNAGRISIKGTRYNDRELQRKLLRAEGVDVSEDMTFAIEAYRFRPDPTLLKNMELSEDYLEMLVEKFTL
jgi:methylated-DNA-protein-cysteine methyltransferase-like protein